MTIGFQRAGCEVIAAYEKDKNAIEIYKKNIGSEIFPCENILNIDFKTLPDSEIIAVNLLENSYFPIGQYKRWDGDYLVGIKKMLFNNRPNVLCMAFPRSFLKQMFFQNFQEEIENMGYVYTYKGISIKELTGLPIDETQFYFIACLSSMQKQIELPKEREQAHYSIDAFLEQNYVDDWYYRVNHEQIQEESQKNMCFCWRRDRYVERDSVDTNLVKLPLVRVNGHIRKITHREFARLKGFPDDIRLDISNKAKLYKQLVCSPHVQVITQLAKVMMNLLYEPPLQKVRGMKGELFEELFAKYLEKKSVKFEREGKAQKFPYDFVIQNQNSKININLKIYNSDYALTMNLKRKCEMLRRIPKGQHEVLILAVASVVDSFIKDQIKKEYDVFIWDVKNLLWMFEEYAEIKNEFISLLTYTVNDIETEPPFPDLFEEKRVEKRSNHWKDRLLEIETGREYFQKYEELCTEILKYVLGDYLSLWAVQEKSNDDLYRFDLCCKIKNGVNQDFFDTIKTYFQTKYIVFEFKNYAEKISQKEIYTTEKYLYKKALRSVAVIISRQGADSHALFATRGCLRENGKLILCLSDNDLLNLIDMKDKDEQPTAEYFEAILDDLLIHLEK